MQIPRCCPQRVSLWRSGMRPKDLHSWQAPGDSEAGGSWTLTAPAWKILEGWKLLSCILSIHCGFSVGNEQSHFKETELLVFRKFFFPSGIQGLQCSHGQWVRNTMAQRGRQVLKALSGGNAKNSHVCWDWSYEPKYSECLKPSEGFIELFPFRGRVYYLSCRCKPPSHRQCLLRGGFSLYQTQTNLSLSSNPFWLWQFS